MDKILIGGGVGFIGTNVAKRFIDAGHDVVVFDNLQRPGVHENLSWLQHYGKDRFQFIWADCRNKQDFNQFPTDVKCVIWLCANPGIPRSIADPEYDYAVNSTGTLNGLEWARQVGKPAFLFASTNKVYSDRINNIGLIETDKRYVPLDPTYLGNDETGTLDSRGDGYCHSPYGCSKLSADQYVQEYFAIYGLPSVVNRMSCIYGLHQQGVEDQGWIDFFVRSLVKGDGQLNIFGTGKQVRDMLDGRDVAELYYQEFVQLEKSQGKVFNVGGGMDNNVSLFEAIEEVEQQVGKKFTLTFCPKRQADHDYYVSDTRHVQSVLGWKQQFTFRKSVRDMISQYGGKI